MTEVVTTDVPLFVAARTGRLQLAKDLLEQGANPNMQTDRAWTPLHSASYHGQADIVKLLIQHNASLEVRYRKARTPLHKASEGGYIECASALLQAGADVNDTTPLGETCLYIAAKEGHFSFVDWVIDAGAQVDHVTNGGWTALQIASYHGKSDVVRVLLNHHANLEHLERKTGRTALHMAAERNHTAIIDMLVNAGAPVEAATNKGSTPLYTASFWGSTEAVRTLLKHNVRVEARNVSKWTPLNTASREGHTEIVKWLLQSSASLEAREDKNHFTPLHHAAIAGHAVIVGMLLDHGANIEIRSKDDSTPLHLAASNGHARVVELLLKRGANCGVRTLASQTPLDLAKEKQRTEVVTLLSAAMEDERVDHELSEMMTSERLSLITTETSAFLSAVDVGPQKWLQKIDGINQEIIMPAAKMMKDVQPVRIAVLDTGLNLAHSHFATYPSERRRIKGHWHDFVESKEKPVDEDKGQHGTMVALLLLRVAKHAEIFIARIASTSSQLQDSGDNIAKAILHAQDPQKWNVDLVCMSFGFAQEIAPIKRAIRQTHLQRDDSVVFFAAAANDGSNQQEMFPASDESVISVRGTDNQGDFIGAYDPPAIFTNEGLPLYGTLGHNVPYTPGQTASGCSVATPVMVGTVAIVMQWMRYSSALSLSTLSDSNLRDDEVIRKLQTTNGVKTVLKMEGVNRGNSRYYFHIWRLFEGHGKKCPVIIAGHMSRLSKS
ncbi:ankyrin unc44 [Xylaria longipes]|nr:ankyrin unc44 [Xylaria longipes]RYC62698.1 hypothetical protein CHU98_g3497 [Xylaria longipes]